MTTMPKIDFSKLDGESLTVAKQITKKDGSLYATKPKQANGLEKYIWRMVMFAVSPKREHHCIPVTAEFDLIDWVEIEFNTKSWMTIMRDQDFKERTKKIEDDIVNTIPKSEWHGVRSWGRALYGDSRF